MNLCISYLSSNIGYKVVDSSTATENNLCENTSYSSICWAVPYNYYINNYLYQSKTSYFMIFRSINNK